MGEGEPADAGPACACGAAQGVTCPRCRPFDPANHDRQSLPGDIGIDLAQDGGDAMAYLVDGWPPRKRPSSEPVFALRSDKRLAMTLEDGRERVLTQHATRVLLGYLDMLWMGEGEDA